MGDVCTTFTRRNSFCAKAAEGKRAAHVVAPSPHPVVPWNISAFSEQSLDFFSHFFWTDTQLHRDRTHKAPAAGIPGSRVTMMPPLPLHYGDHTITPATTPRHHAALRRSVVVPAVPGAGVGFPQCGCAHRTSTHHPMATNQTSLLGCCTSWVDGSWHPRAAGTAWGPGNQRGGYRFASLHSCLTPNPSVHRFTQGVTEQRLPGLLLPAHTAVLMASLSKAPTRLLADEFRHDWYSPGQQST